MLRNGSGWNIRRYSTIIQQTAGSSGIQPRVPSGSVGFFPRTKVCLYLPLYSYIQTGAEESPKSKRFSWKPFLMFSTFNALPVCGIAFYLNNSIEGRRLELENMSDLIELPPVEAASRVQSICRSCRNATVVGADKAVPILPHAPEEAPLVLTTDELVNNVNRTIPGTASVFDALSASRDVSQSVPFRSIHFGVSADSWIAQQIETGRDRRITIVYNGGQANDVSLTVVGTAVIVEDERLRQYYWRDRWNGWIPRHKYLLIKLVPNELTVNSLNGGETFASGVTLRRSNDEWVR